MVFNNVLDNINLGKLDKRYWRYLATGSSVDKLRRRLLQVYLTLGVGVVNFYKTIVSRTCSVFTKLDGYSTNSNFLNEMYFRIMILMKRMSIFLTSSFLVHYAYPYNTLPTKAQFNDLINSSYHQSSSRTVPECLITTTYYVSRGKQILGWWMPRPEQSWLSRRASRPRAIPMAKHLIQ